MSSIEARLADGLTQGLYKNAVLNIRHLDGRNLSYAVGNATWFDLASLTKPLAIGTLVAQALSDHTLKKNITVMQLLTHTAGLLPFRDWYRHADTGKELISLIHQDPLDYTPGTRTVYSDAGFILLAQMLALHSSIADLFKSKIAIPLKISEIDYGPLDKDRRKLAAPTGFSPFRKRDLAGEVHDDNAYILAKNAGHAGLFGTATAVSKLALLWLDPDALKLLHIDPNIARKFVAIPADGRPWAWDRVDAGISQAGTQAPLDAYGHLGFTGTSVWVSPGDNIAITLLTDRIAHDVDGGAFRSWRPELYDMVWKLNQNKKLF